ncbi:translation factor SUA5 [Tenacibaculum sp. MAR_2009_124]|uniref:L-threonylcarbamoyladenylate synthase n=1 Tax=Tenacibaculum sp. MAR_2009_124 TaxID=1250059 RepID=UPI0008953AFE|nr:L-threonylcarbamoyladenylate synthase [Tenacibaculum sp. MAR_2009_124]SEB52160.1 translation factor SUA5 [Tenacibaculum sp. MAR_2009_124]
MITKKIDIAIESLNNGNLVAIPTETVYGLSGNAFDEKVIEKIFTLKERPLNNPLIVHIKSYDYLEKIAKDVPDIAMKLAKNFWPGPLTLVLNKKHLVPDIVTAGKETVAIRVPSHPLTLEILEKLDFPLAAPSANPFSTISPTTAEHVDHYFGNDLEVILDGGVCEKGIESTIIGFEGEYPIVYRLGSLSIEEIENKIGKVYTKNKNDVSPVAPGMLSRHYAPRTEMVLVDEPKSKLKYFPNKKVGVLSFKNTIKSLQEEDQEILSREGNLNEAGKKLYAAMHRLDSKDFDIILAERLPNVGIGKTINDKLERATKKEDKLESEIELFKDLEKDIIINSVFPGIIP